MNILISYRVGYSLRKDKKRQGSYRNSEISGVALSLLSLNGMCQVKKLWVIYPWCLKVIHIFKKTKSIFHSSQHYRQTFLSPQKLRLMYSVGLRKATKCLCWRRVRPSAQNPELGELSRQSPSQAFCPLQGTEKLSEDKETPPPGKVNSLVMSTTFSKSKFVTCSLNKRPEYNR